jgi:hypothetical protein
LVTAHEGVPDGKEGQRKTGRFPGGQRLGFGSSSGMNARVSARGRSRRQHDMQDTIQDSAHACKPK